MIGKFEMTMHYRIVKTTFFLYLTQLVLVIYFLMEFNSYWLHCGDYPLTFRDLNIIVFRRTLFTKLV